MVNFTSNAIPRLRDVDPLELQQRYFDPGRPCVLEAFNDAAELARWADLLSVSNEKVACVIARSRNIAKISDAPRPPVERAAELPELNEFLAELSLAEAWQRIREPQRHQPLLAAGECVYLIEADLPESLRFPSSRSGSALAELVFADPRPPQTILNMPGMINRNHTHVHEVLLHQMFGHKKVRLFSPADTPNLYMNDERRSNVADFDRPDLERFPRVAQATAWQAELEPGDVLFLPSYWWHEIRVDEPAISLGFPVQAGRWARAMFGLHHAMAELLERTTSDPLLDAQTARGTTAIVAAATAGALLTNSLAETISGLRYDYD